MPKKQIPPSDRLLEALRLVAPGTVIREALDNIVRARTGALLVFADKDQVDPLVTGGIPIGAELTPMVVYELAKMDGGILFTRDGSRITHANVHLMPDPSIPSMETGTRHRTAERVAKQIDALVLSISAARDVVSLYIDGTRYVLEEIRVILTKANQALQTLEKYKSRLTQVSTSLSALEFEDAVTLYDVLSVLQRSEMVLRVAREIERYIVELGGEGRLIRMQLEELMVDVREDQRSVLLDYLPDFADLSADEVAVGLSRLDSDAIVSLPRIGELLGYAGDVDPIELHVSARGHRMLRKIPRLPKGVIVNLVGGFSSLEDIINATTDELVAVDGVSPARAHDIKEGFLRLRELNLLERYG
ncbi:MAG: DNA integrity scanning diadenylate cyclase DisA [Actinobacteria bacterium]|nr:DNA integrity scanning diadenylate cyclase DisA [Actinomycetota bacterium]